MKTKLLPASANDFLEISAIQHNDDFQHAYYLTDKRYRYLISKGEQFYLFQLENKIIGFVGLDIDVRAQVHFFLEKIISLIEEKNIQTSLIFVVIEESAQKFRKFLEKNGFYTAGRHDNRFGKDKHGIIFNYQLS